MVDRDNNLMANRQTLNNPHDNNLMTNRDNNLIT